MNKIYKILFYTCLISIEFLATTTLKIEVVESIWDKANHFIAFFVLYILLSLAYKKFKTITKFILLVLFGMQIEIVQHFIDGRYFSLMDVVADTIGIILGILFYKYFYRKYMSA